VLLDDEAGTEAMRRYYDGFARLASERGTGLVLESPTWRASKRWASELGYSADELADFNRRAIALLAEIREPLLAAGADVVISGCIGPHGDGYDPVELLSAPAARDYHSEQIGTFAGTDADMVNAMTMTYVEEAIGVVEAARSAGIPAAISFTVETDGRLPSGQPLGEAIEQVNAETGGGAAYFMINCAHPTHFAGVLDDGDWVSRIRGLRANASEMSHAELDEAEELDDGDPADLARRYADLATALPNLNVVGGCCGTDIRHVRAISEAWPAA